ncbi:MAG: UDP-N-acetylmuramoyl-L-alanine--D-glutamate ligase, partial [Negativicutes bacterium]|nr:UDP-N-acetylmuramoyl-L-alanine--D-glutamate ligase [Negativicutes bacterium]
MDHDKPVLMIGGGRSGWAVARFFAGRRVPVTIYDQKKLDWPDDWPADCDRQLVSLVSGEQPELDLSGFGRLVVSPGVSVYHQLVVAAAARGIPVISELELAWTFSPADCVAVTGTNGKTTVTTMIGRILSQAGRRVVVGGNIGTPLISLVDRIDRQTVVVAEVSSFQLEAARTFAPKVAVVLNLTPDHLDRHRTFDQYRQCKEKIFSQQRPENRLVLNADDPVVAGMRQRAPGQVWWFSLGGSCRPGTWLDRGKLWLDDGQGCQLIMERRQLPLPGDHNVANALAAAAAAAACQVETAAIAGALTGFTGVEHRIEKCGQLNGKDCYNDSKATNPESAIVALQAFDQPLIWLAGGKDKLTDLSELMNLAA